MILSDTLQIEGWNAALGVSGRWIVLTTSKQRFRGLLQQLPAIDPQMPFGGDIREKLCVEALRTDVPASLLAAHADSQVPCTIDGVPHKLTNRDDNIASPFVRFDIVKVVN